MAINIEFKSPGEFFFRINQVFHWILAAPLAIFIILFLEWRTDNWLALVTEPVYHDLILYSFLPGVLALWFIGFRGFRDRMQETDTSAPLQDKLQWFVNAFIRQQVFYTLSALLAMAGIYLTGSNLFMVYYIALIFYLSINRPAPGTISKALRLDKQETSILRKKQSFPDGNNSEQEGSK